VQGAPANIQQMLIDDPDLDQAALGTDAILTMEESATA